MPLSDISNPISSPDYINLQEQQAANTDGGTSIATTWTTCVVNTEVMDAGNHCSLSANQFTLDAGTYDILASKAVIGGAVNGNFKLRLRNITDSTTVIVGMSCYGAANGIGPTDLSVRGRFTIGGGKALALQYWAAAGVATNGLGVKTNASEIEVFCIIELRKIA